MQYITGARIHDINMFGISVVLDMNLLILLTNISLITKALNISFSGSSGWFKPIHGIIVHLLIYVCLITDYEIPDNLRHVQA